MSAHKLFKWYFVFVLCIEVKSKVCFNVEKIITQNIVTYGINESRVVNVSSTRSVPVCCQGFVRKNTDLVASGNNCVKPCQTECFGGYCNALNECVCYDNYERHLTINTCVRKCKPGFKTINNICRPQCSSPCHGGKCVASDKCSCDSGWELNEGQKCVRIKACDPPCGNGICNDRNMCVCQHGYELQNDMSPRCVQPRQSCKKTDTTYERCVCPPHYTAQHVDSKGDCCYCSNNCDTKCFKGECVLDSILKCKNPSSTVDSDPSSSNDNDPNNEDTTASKPEESEPSGGNWGSQTSNIEHHSSTTIKQFNTNEGPYNMDVIITLSVLGLGTIAIVALIILIIRELRTS